MIHVAVASYAIAAVVGITLGSFGRDQPPAIGLVLWLGLAVAATVGGARRIRRDRSSATIAMLAAAPGGFLLMTAFAVLFR